MEHIRDNSFTGTKTWRACGYVRLSHEDGDKEESNSITGQKNLIRDFFSRHPELEECGMAVDDGFSGSSFERPAFQKMMDDVRAQKIDCIVVKDLSRFGRNYLDAGEYIEKIFPFFGVRFIAVNDSYDSLDNAASDGLVVPFKNLINEAYCRDSSVKIRSCLEVKRRRGDFTGAFAVYGYLKDPQNKNHLVVDTFAADVVRDIYQWKLDGVSAADIAGRLNADGILAPMDYKRQQGLRFATPFRIRPRSPWSATAVLRILKNPVYTGILEQGKNTTLSYKVKKRVAKPRGEWAVVESAHEAVVDRQDFLSVQKVLALDTRKSPGRDRVELFSGMVLCGECGAAMVRKTVPSGGKKYIYYVCAAHKNEKTCFSHSIRDTALEKIVLESLQKQIQYIISLAELLKMADTAPLRKAGAKKVHERMKSRKREADRYRRLMESLYENMVDGVITREEYHQLKKNYSELCSEAEKQAEGLQEEMVRMLESSVDGNGWMDQFKKYGNITELDRTAVVSLIDRIFIYRDRRVDIIYSCQDELRLLDETLAQVQGSDGKTESFAAESSPDSTGPEQALTGKAGV